MVNFSHAAFASPAKIAAGCEPAQVKPALNGYADLLLE